MRIIEQDNYERQWKEKLCKWTDLSTIEHSRERQRAWDVGSESLGLQ